MDIYSPYKVLHHTDKIELLKIGEKPYPAQIQIDLTNVCNHGCLYCVYRHEQPDGVDFKISNHIKTDRLLALLEELKEVGVKAVIFQGGGEPFLHPGICDALDKIKELKLELGIITNGTAIKEKHIEKLGVASWIRFSIDAATNETYQKVQVTNNNIPQETIKQIKQKYPHIVVGMSFLTKPQNYMEAYDFAIMAKDLGVDNIRYSIVQTLDGVDIVKPFYDEYFKLVNMAKSLESDSFRVFGLQERSDSLKNNKQYSTCYYQHFVGAIAANGNLYPCCWTKNMEKFAIGNINEQSFKDIWTGQNRIQHLKNQDVKECPPCWFDKTNELLTYILKKDPKHVNFV